MYWVYGVTEYKREWKHIKGAQAHYGQILAHKISEFPEDVDQLPKHDAAARVTAYCFHKLILLKGL